MKQLLRRIFMEILNDRNGIGHDGQIGKRRFFKQLRQIMNRSGGIQKKNVVFPDPTESAARYRFFPVAVPADPFLKWRTGRRVSCRGTFQQRDPAMHPLHHIARGQLRNVPVYRGARHFEMGGQLLDRTIFLLLQIIHYRKRAQILHRSSSGKLHTILRIFAKNKPGMIDL